MRLHAWGIEHDSHGYSISEICFLAADDEPDTKPERGIWVRLPWLDSDVSMTELRAATKQHDSHGYLVTTPCCPHPVERHAYNGCANCSCAVTWLEHPDRLKDTSRAGREALDRLTAPKRPAFNHTRADSPSDPCPVCRVAIDQNAAYEIGRADERIAVGELLVAVEMVFRDLPGNISLDEAKRVLTLVRDYRKVTDDITAIGREKGWYPK